MVLLPTKNPASPPAKSRLGSRWQPQFEAEHHERRPAHNAVITEITMISLAFGFLHKKGSMAAITTIGLQRAGIFRPPHIFTEKNRRIGTTISMTANANQVRRLTFPWRSIWRIIIPSDGRVYSSSSSEGTSFRWKGFLFSRVL